MKEKVQAMQAQNSIEDENRVFDLVLNMNSTSKTAKF
jgi:hypothetical protein